MVKYRWSGETGKFFTNGEEYEFGPEDDEYVQTVDDEGDPHSWSVETMTKDGWIKVETGPIRTETVTTRRIEPGVYGPLEVRKEGKEPMECGGKKEPVVYAYLIPTYLNAAGWRDLARVATELAEFLDAQ